MNNRRVYQHLSRSKKNGLFYLSTVYTEEGGEVVLAHISPKSPLEMVEVLESTLFMKALDKIAEGRDQR